MPLRADVSLRGFGKRRSLQPQTHAIRFFGYAIGVCVKRFLGCFRKPVALRAGCDAQDLARGEEGKRFRRNFSLAIRGVGSSCWRRTGGNACPTLSFADPQHVTFAQRTAFVAAEAAEKMRRGTSEKRFHFDSTPNAQIATRSRPRRAELKRLSGFHFERLPRWKGITV